MCIYSWCRNCTFIIEKKSQGAQVSAELNDGNKLHERYTNLLGGCNLVRELVKRSFWYTNLFGSYEQGQNSTARLNFFDVSNKDKHIIRHNDCIKNKNLSNNARDRNKER